MYHVIQSHSTIKSRYGSLWDWKYFHVVGNHVIENHVNQGMTVVMKIYLGTSPVQFCDVITRCTWVIVFDEILGQV